MNHNKYHTTLNPAIKNNSHMGLAMRIRPKQRVLELGCSSGYLSQYLKEELGCQVVGVEIDADALQQAAPFCQQTIMADLDTGSWLAEIAGQQFDVVLCADVLEHLKNPAHMLQSLKPYLHAKSYILASVPNVAHVSIRLELLQGHFDYESLGLLDNTHLHFYTRNGLVALFIQAGYECSDISYSINDMADKAIEQHLNNAGLQMTDAARERLHAPDAVAFQYIVEARPAHANTMQDMPRPLSPKPLVSSGVAYQEMHEKIDHLKHQLGVERARHQQQISQLVTEDNKPQKIPHIWDKTTVELDNALFSLAQQLQHEQVKNNDLSDKVKQLEGKNNERVADTQRLEQVLQRVHRKISYRLVRAVKNFPKRIKGFLPKRKRSEQLPALDKSSYAVWQETYSKQSEQTIAALKKEVNGWQKLTEIALVMSVQNPETACLQNAIDSILQQVYGHFELYIAGDASIGADQHQLLQSYMARDSRIKVTIAEQYETPSALLNNSLSWVKADYVAVVGQYDQLTPDALYWIAKAIWQNPDAQLIYTDEDKMDLQGRCYQPCFKPDWNPELFLAYDFISHLAVYKTYQVQSLGGFKAEFEAAQEYDLALRYVAGLSTEQIVHIPRILYHCNDISVGTTQATYEVAAVKAVKNALEHKCRLAEVSVHKQLPRAIRVRYLLPDKLPLVSIVIPTRNGAHLLHRCVESIFAKTAYANYELIIIDNGSDDIVALRYLRRLNQDPRVTVIRDESPFNYSTLNNNAVAQASGELIALLNNDLEVINAEWLDEMVSHVLHHQTGAVGAKLYYPNDTIQHAGVVLGIRGVAGHAHKHFSRDATGYCGRLLLAQNFSAVTAACLLVRKDVFQEVGGFDEQNLSVAFNDVDLCLRIQQYGYQNIWTPYAELYHYESASRGYEDTPEKQQRFNNEIAYMQQRWGKSLLIDPAYNLNLTLDRDDFSFAWPPRL